MKTSLQATNNALGIPGGELQVQPGATASVESTRFGSLQVDQQLVITMTEGLIGFENCKRYVVLDPDESNPIKWLQSLDDGGIAFPIVDPWRFKPDYAPTISDVDAKSLGLTDETPKL